MFSPETLYRSVPRTIEENLRFREWILGECRGEPRRQRQMMEACKRDALFYISAFAWQFNPRRKGAEVGPFIAWDCQDEATLTILECIETDRDLVIEKSREMGASWMCLLAFEWLWHFHPWKQFLVISRNEDAVESKSPDSLFWKLDFIHKYQPAWMRPEIRRQKLFFGNDTTGSTITGQATTGKAGVGGRATAMLIDEFSQIDQDFEVLNRTADTTGCRIFNFTHVGTGTAAYSLCERPDMKKLRLHWSQHPLKQKGLYRYDKATNRIEVLDKAYRFPPDYPFVRMELPAGGPYPGVRSPWYDRECIRRKDPRAIAMDLDIDAKGSARQFFDPVVIRDLIQNYACDPIWSGDLDADLELGRPRQLVSAPGGSLSLWFTPGDGVRVPKGQYAIGCDLSAGTGATPSCVTILNRLTGEKVGEYATPFLGPGELAPIVVALCWLFQTWDGEGAMLAWEQQGPGIKFGQRVLELGYRNIYFRSDDLSLSRVISDRPGWVPNNQTKRLLLEDYRSALYSRMFLNRSEAALKETLAFGYTSRGTIEHGSYETTDDPTGARENHSDRVIGDALAWKISKDLVSGNLAKPGKRAADELNPNSLAGRRRLAERAASQADEWV